MTDELPEIILAALAERNDPELEADTRRMWADADSLARVDILAFFESDGPEKIRQCHLRREDGIPTAHDLHGWLP